MEFSYPLMQTSYVSCTEILNKTLLVMETNVYFILNEKARTKTLCYTQHPSTHPILFTGSSFLCE